MATSTRAIDIPVSADVRIPVQSAPPISRPIASSIHFKAIALVSCRSRVQYADSSISSARRLYPGEARLAK